MLRNFFGNIPVVAKNLLILNLLVFVFIITGGGSGISYQPTNYLGLHYFGSPDFKPYQIVSHMFSHGSPAHLIFNMLALVMFGGILERLWGPKRFLIFYLVAGLGAVFLQECVQAWQVYHVAGEFMPSCPTSIGPHDAQSWMFATGDDSNYQYVGSIYYTPTVGASGAIYGLLIAFAMLFPNTELMLLFFPVPIKAKYLVPVMIVIELVLSVNDFKWDNIAHFAHLGGALFGFILIKIWQRKRNDFY
jgi:membrane associated rhomboid family serine protease